MNQERSKDSAWHPAGIVTGNRWVGRIAIVMTTLAIGACATTGNYADPQAIWAKNGSEHVNRIEIRSAPPGAQTAGSIEISPSQLRSVLAGLRYRTREGEVLSVFTDDALDKIVKPLSRGLGRLQPGQGLIFAVTQKRTDQIIAVFMDPKLTTGRVFVTDEGLNIIFGRIDSAYADTYHVTGMLPELEPGQRNEPAGKAWTVLEGKFVDYARPGRDDWIVIEPKAWLMAEPVSRNEAAGAAPAANAPAANLAQPGNPYYRETRGRLEAIKKLHQDGLISDQEYQELRSRILNNLTGSQ